MKKEVIEHLLDFLATTYSLYLKTQNFHWNLVGPDFMALHLLFQKQYEEMAEAVDEIAERVRALDAYVDGSFSGFSKRSKILDSKKPKSQKKMIEELLKGHQALSAMGYPMIRRCQELKDDVSSDLLIRRVTFHDKAAWILKSHL